MRAERSAPARSPATLKTALLGACALGLAFGAVTSMSNGILSPSDEGAIATAVRVTSHVLDAGWAWAAVAFVAGCLAGSPARGAAAGFVALVAATIAYYGMDSILREEPLSLYWREMLRWWLGSAIFGPVLGCIGAYARRPGVVGLLAGLVIPIGAAAQMVLMPPGGAVTGSTTTSARIVVVVIAAVWAAAVVGRFLTRRPT